MPNPNAVLTINFNLKLDELTDAKLIWLAKTRHQAKAAVLRSLIRATYEMTNNHQPTCADTTACRCPHAHVYAPQPPPADPDGGRNASD